MKTTLQIHQSTFELRRYPIQKDEKFQAWDCVDEYIIDHLFETPCEPNSHLLIMNDTFGALCCWALQEGFQVTAVNDSLLSQQNIKANLKANALSGVRFLSSLDKIPEDIDVAIIKLTHNHRFLVWQLEQLSQLLCKNIKVISASKAKDIHSSTLKLFEKHLGKTRTSLAKKKARLIFCEKKTPSSSSPKPPLPLKETTEFEVPEYHLRLENHANVFSGQRLDIAAYLMLKHIPAQENIKHIIDIGCGNGVLCVLAAKLNPQAKITAVDESYMAVASAALNLKNNAPENKNTQCVINNCLDGFDPQSADLILCNPPFHQLKTVSTHIAWQMFCDAKRVLEPQGRILVIANRHLGYHAKLKHLFGNARTVASNQKFVIIESIKNTHI